MEQAVRKIALLGMGTVGGGVSEIIERANYTNEIQVNDVEMYASFCIYGQLGIILNTDISIKEKSSRIKAFFRDLFRL